MSQQQKTQLWSLFCPHLAPSLQKAAKDAHDRIETLLLDTMNKAQKTLGNTEICQEEFLQFIAKRIPDRFADNNDLLNHLEKLRTEDLALAWACGNGDEKAVATVENACFDVVEVAVARMPEAVSQLDEIKQRLRERLLVSKKGEVPRISQYAGRGDLRGWVRVAAVRCAIDVLRENQPQADIPQELMDLVAPHEANEELKHLKKTYRTEFKHAFEKALATLPSRDQNILKYHYLDRLNIDQIGAIFGVHRATVARWLGKTRSILLADTRRFLMQKLKIDRPEFESIMRLISSNLDASIERYLKP